MSVGEILTLVAILTGPAVGAGITLLYEARKQKREPKWQALYLLMRNRREYMSPDFVGTINVVPLLFHKESRVITSWRQLIAIYSDNPAWKSNDPEIAQRLAQRIQRAIAELIGEMAKALHLKLETLSVNEDAYRPQLWGEQEDLLVRSRRMLVELFEGRRLIPVMVYPAPVAPSHPNEQYSDDQPSKAEAS